MVKEAEALFIQFDSELKGIRAAMNEVHDWTQNHNFLLAQMGLLDPVSENSALNPAATSHGGDDNAEAQTGAMNPRPSIEDLEEMVTSADGIVVEFDFLR